MGAPGCGKKGAALAPLEVSYLLNQLSKAALLDLCCDMLHRAHGEDISAVEAVRLLMEEYLPPVLRVREDKMPSSEKAIAQANAGRALFAKIEAEKAKGN